MRHIIAVLTIALLAVGSSDARATCAGTQIITTSWHGLSGLFVIPTARQIGKGNFAIGFNEAKHVEFVDNVRAMDRQIRGVGTYGLTGWLEIYGSFYNNLLCAPRPPVLNNRSFNSFGFKARLMKEHPRLWYPEVAVAIRDVGNSTADVGPLSNINNGTKGFILASKRLFQREDIGRFLDLHAGVTFDHNETAALLGFELTIAQNVSLLCEGMWDSPFLNFRDYGGNNVGGRFIFDPGIRVYPEMVPGLVLDMGFIGDSEFEFSFGISYVIDL